ncbi:MAG: Superoxide dismutase [Candidatus Saccharibacteria bacterium GW2011_GWA2_46_10]|nr:MAG: Superoxide dismutase [Candidatus Saccharibacteria bacterium GW2011_GWA2_46_10]
MFKLPDLGYAFDALEPHIDAKTMEIHHDKHHGAYVEKLNAALEKYSDSQSKTIEELLSGIKDIPEDIRTAVQNNGGGHHNHTLFWESMKPGGTKDHHGELADVLKSTFGSLDEFKAKMTEAAIGRFGSGWAWLVKNGGKLEVYSTANQDSPLMEGKTPVLGLDVWEHAYYVKYLNRRPEYIEAWWNVVNWDVVKERI